MYAIANEPWRRWGKTGRRWGKIGLEEAALEGASRGSGSLAGRNALVVAVHTPPRLRLAPEGCRAYAQNPGGLLAVAVAALEHGLDLRPTDQSYQAS